MKLKDVEVGRKVLLVRWANGSELNPPFHIIRVSFDHFSTFDDYGKQSDALHLVDSHANAEVVGLNAIIIPAVDLGVRKWVTSDHTSISPTASKKTIP